MRFRTAALAVLLAPAAAFAQEAPPPAEQIVARYVEAIGGRDAVMAKQSFHMLGEFSMPAMGVTGTVETYQAQPNLTVLHIDLGGIGRISAGYNGEVAWEVSPMQGARVKEGAELEQAKDEASVESMLRDPSLYETMETLGRATWNGQDCWRVRLVRKSTGREVFECYATDTGLLVGSEMKAATAMGEIPATVTVEDYRDFGGILLPTKIRQEAMGAEQVFTFTTVTFDNVDPAVFELPAEIKALIK